MKNYLIKGLHRIKSTVWWPGSDRSWEGDLYPYYQQMNEISKASFFQNLAGDWSLINLVSNAEDVNHVFRQQFQAIWDIWSSEPCNILYCGSDTQMIKPTEIFGKYHHFLMFNYTDPKSLGDCTHFLNADIRYYPAEMSRDLFQDGLEQIKSMNEWNGDQLLYNKMVWDQGLVPEQVIDPKMAYQGPWLPGDQAAKDFTDQWNGCRLEDAHVVHWHGSRHAAAKLALMQQLNDQLGVPTSNEKNIEVKTINVSHIP
jgi:hypothetical protein